jgi:type II secretory pathway pseudopilin PulG
MKRANGHKHSTQAPARSNGLPGARLGGFSTMELLLVLSIFGLLVGYAAPYYLGQTHFPVAAGNCQPSVTASTEKK